MATLMLKNRPKRPVARTRVGKTTKAHPVSLLPHGVQKYVAAQVDGFGQAAKGAWVPNSWAKPSVKSDAVTRGVFKTNLNQSHNFLFIHPASCDDRASFTHIAVSEGVGMSGMIGTKADENQTDPYFVKHIWTSADYGTSGAQFTSRAVSTSLRLKYVGHNLSKGGNVMYLRLADHQPIIGAIADGAGEDPPKWNTSTTFEELYSFIASNRYMRMNSFLHNTEMDYSFTNRPDVAYRNDWHFIRRKNHSKYSDTQAAGAANNFSAAPPVIAVLYWQTTDAKQQFQYEVISHVEAKADRLAQIATASPSHPTEHGEIQQHIDKAHETHNDTPETPLLTHVLSTIKTEASSVVSKAGRSLFSNMMSELRKPSTYESIGTGLLAGLL